MCGRGQEGPWSALVDADPRVGHRLGPGNTNQWVPGGCWVGTRYTHPPSTRYTPPRVLPLPTHHPPCTKLTVQYTASNSRFEADQGDPRGVIRTVVVRDTPWLCLPPAATLRHGSTAPPSAPTLRIFSVFLSISQYILRSPYSKISGILRSPVF